MSIIVPTYNMEKYLSRCLKSLVVSKEYLSSLEVLIINDGSKDHSSTIGHEFESKHPQTFRVIDKENGNYGSCINRGLREARGKYVKILDADDYYDTVAFEKYLSKLSGIDTDIVTNHFDTVNEEGQLIRTFKFDFGKEKNHLLKDCDSYLLTIITMHGLAYRREMLLANDYKQTEGISYTDQEWSFMPFGMAKTLYDSDEKIYEYLIGREGQTMEASKMASSVRHLEKVAYSLIDYYSSGKWDSWLDYIFTKKMMMLISSIYTIYLLNSDKFESHELKKFDDNLLNLNKKLYDCMDNQFLHEKVLKIRYIYLWRNNKKISLKMSLFLYNVMKKIRNL